MRKFRKFVFRFGDGFVVVLPLAVVLGIFACFTGPGALSDLLDGALFQDLSLHYPVYADLNAQGDLFVIDQNSRRIVSIGPDSRERWAVSGGQRSGGVYETYRLAATPDGGAVAYNYIRDPADDSKSGEQLVLFGPDGAYRGILVDLEFPPGHRTSDDELIGSFQITQGAVVYSLQNGKTLDLRRRSLDPRVGGTNPEGHEKLFSAPVTLDIVTSVPHLPQGLVVADRAGGLSVVAQDGRVSTPPFAQASNHPGFEKPWDLKVGPGGALYLLDNFRSTVWKAPSLDSPGATEVFSESVVLAKGRNRPSFEAIAVGPQGTLAVVDKFNGSVFLVGSDGKLRVVTGATKSDADLWGSWLLVGLDFAAFFLGVWALVGLVRRQFADKTSLIVKQILFFLPLVVLSVGFGAAPIFRLMDDQFQKELRSKLALVAGLGARMIDGELVGQINHASDWDGPAHRALGTQYDGILRGNADPWNRDLRAVVYKYQNDRFYFVKNSSSYYGVMFPYGGAQPEHFAAARGGTVETALYSDEYGSYLSGIAPVRGDNGRITGVLEVYHNYNTVTENTAAFFGQLLWGIVTVLVTVLALLVAVDVLIFLSLGSLRDASHKLMGGELGLQVGIRRRDEIGDLAQDFNTMSSRLREHFDRLEAIRDSNARFVPSAFLDFLGKESLAAVSSGDQVRRRVTVFFADIRSFTTLSEGMTPKENFDFVNDYFSVMGPVIRACGGFIDRYLGDAIMALFPHSPQDAVDAGFRMREVLVGFNAARTDRGLAPVDFGVGIHTDEVILGVVGQSNRLSVTVISEAVDLVNRLEAATKEHHVGMVVTQSVWEGLTLLGQQKARRLGSLADGEASYDLWGF
jgi:class 3 adenylate cyclase